MKIIITSLCVVLFFCSASSTALSSVGMGRIGCHSYISSGVVKGADGKVVEIASEFERRVGALTVENGISFVKDRELEIIKRVSRVGLPKISDLQFFGFSTLLPDEQLSEGKSWRRKINISEGNDLSTLVVSYKIDSVEQFLGERVAKISFLISGGDSRAKWVGYGSEIMSLADRCSVLKTIEMEKISAGKVSWSLSYAEACAN